MPKKKVESAEFREDGHMTLERALPGMRFILLRGDKVVRDKLFSTAVEVFVKLWQPTVWTKEYTGQEAAATKHPTALNLRKGTPAHIREDQEIQILY